MKHDHVSTRAQHPGCRGHPHRQHIRPPCPGTHLLRSRPPRWPLAFPAAKGFPGICPVPCVLTGPCSHLLRLLWLRVLPTSGLRQQECFLSKFRRPDVLNPGVCRPGSSRARGRSSSSASGPPRVISLSASMLPSGCLGVSHSPSSCRKPVSTQGPPQTSVTSSDLD